MKNYIVLFFILAFLFSCKNDKDNTENWAKTQLLKESNFLVKKILVQGKTSGTFLFEYKGSLSWSGEPQLPVLLKIEKTENKEVVYEQKITDKNKFAISLELRPGSYVLLSKLLNNDERTYKDAVGPVFDINEKGDIQYINLPLEHKFRLNIISPQWGDIIKEKRPIIKWEAVQSAFFYSVYYSEEDCETGNVISKKDINKITKTEYIFESDVRNNTLITWEVRAFDENGMYVAESSRSFIVKYE